MLNFFKSFFARTEVSPEQAVLIHLKLSDDEFGESGETFELYPFEDEIESIVNNAGVGALDGHEFGGGYAVFFLYGIDANRLYSAIEKRVLEQPARSGSFVVKRFGSPGSNEERIELLH